jgi:hypothetical protein
LKKIGNFFVGADKSRPPGSSIEMEAMTSILCQAAPNEKKIPEEESDTVRTHKSSGRD